MRATPWGSEPAQQYRALAIAQLQRIAGFEKSEPAVVRGWVESGALVRVARGEFVCRRDEVRHDLLLVVEGALVLGRQLGQPDAHLAVHLRPGDLQGLISLFDGGPSVYDVMAHEASVLLRIPRHVVLDSFTRSEAVREALIRNLAHRCRIVHDRLHDTVRLPLGARLARQLDFFGKYFGIQRPQGLQLSIRVSQAELAATLGASRQQVNGELRKFADRGLISLSRTAIVIHDAQALEASGHSNQPLTLLRAATPPVAPGAEPATPNTDPQGQLANRRVLLVDDDPVVRLLLATQLRQVGADVVEAADGRAACDKVLRDPLGFDVIVMDEHMPTLSGVAATRRIRAHQGSQGQRPTPILGVSSDAGRKDTRRFIAAGMNAHLAKPFSREEFIEAVRRLLG